MIRREGEVNASCGCFWCIGCDQRSKLVVIAQARTPGIPETVAQFIPFSDARHRMRCNHRVGIMYGRGRVDHINEVDRLVTPSLRLCHADHIPKYITYVVLTSLFASLVLLTFPRRHCPRHQYTAAKVERARMAAEDAVCLAWNSEHRREKEVIDPRARMRSTPIQRGMDPKGVAAARRLLRVSPALHGRAGDAKVNPAVGMESRRQGEQNDRRFLMLERVRRRECYRTRLDDLLQKALVHRRRVTTPTRKLKELGSGKSTKGGIDGDDNTRGSRPVVENQLSSTAEKARRAERDGAECDLTVDMLAHLGPLKDLTGLELCVEGLTSAALLHACTSLKSLSLNVNRLTSPPDLVGGSNLIRLGLR